jgi:hypothetical protein
MPHLRSTYAPVQRQRGQPPQPTRSVRCPSYRAPPPTQLARVHQQTPART